MKPFNSYEKWVLDIFIYLMEAFVIYDNHLYVSITICWNKLTFCEIKLMYLIEDEFNNL